MVRTYTTRAEKEELLRITIRSVDNCFMRRISNRNIFNVAQTFKDNINKARAANSLEIADVADQLKFARLAMQTWTSTAHTTHTTGVGLAAINRRLILADRVELLKSILDNWEVDTQWRMQDYKLSFPFHIDRDTASQNPTPRVSNPGTAGVPGPTLSQLNHMLLELKQLSS
jgi:hypothetical protein